MPLGSRRTITTQNPILVIMSNGKLFRRASDSSSSSSSSSSLSSSNSDPDDYEQKGQKIDVAAASHPAPAPAPASASAHASASDSIPSFVVGVGRIADVDEDIRTFVRQLMESPCSVGSDKTRMRHVRNLVYRRCAWLDLPETEDASSREMHEMYNDALKKSVAFFARKGVKGDHPSVSRRSDDQNDFCKHLRAVFSYLNEYYLVRKGLPRLESVAAT